MKDEVKMLQGPPTTSRGSESLQTGTVKTVCTYCRAVWGKGSTKVTPPTKTPLLARQLLTKCQKVAQRIIWPKLPVFHQHFWHYLWAANRQWKEKQEKVGQLKSAESGGTRHGEKGGRIYFLDVQTFQVTKTVWQWNEHIFTFPKTWKLRSVTYYIVKLKHNYSVCDIREQFRLERLIKLPNVNPTEAHTTQFQLEVPIKTSRCQSWISVSYIQQLSKL